LPFSISITSAPSGSVVAKGATDQLSAMLLTHAGFQQIDDWYGRRHRLASTTSVADRKAVAAHAAEMLRAARYEVHLDPALAAPAQVAAGTENTQSPYAAGAELLALGDEIQAAETGMDLVAPLERITHPEHGAMEQLRQLLDGTAEQLHGVNDGEAEALAVRFGRAADRVFSARMDLMNVTDQLRHLPKASPSPARRTRPASPANPAATAPAALQSPPCRPRTH
jgi:hypothetical protein